MDITNSYDGKDSFMELEKSLATQAANKRRKNFWKKIIVISVIAIIIILAIILIIVLNSKQKDNEGKEEEKEIFNGVIKAKYLINDLSKKIKIINTPLDKLKISVFNNGKKVMDLKDDETEIFFNDIVDNRIELKYQGKLTNLNSLFSDIINLEEIDLTEMNTSEVITMEKLFYGCFSLKNVNMDLLHISNLENINSIFEKCENLEIINMKNFDTKNIITTKSSFENCKKLSKINIEYFDLTKVTDASNMFANCNSLTNINLKNDEIRSSQINMKSIFNGDYSLQKIDLINLIKKQL